MQNNSYVYEKKAIRDWYRNRIEDDPKFNSVSEGEVTIAIIGSIAGAILGIYLGMITGGIIGCVLFGAALWWFGMFVGIPLRLLLTGFAIIIAIIVAGVLLIGAIQLIEKIGGIIAALWGIGKI